MAADAYRQVTYLNDTTYENTQVLVEYATNGSLGTATNQSYIYTADGIMTVYAMSVSATGESDSGITGASTLTTNPTAYGAYGVYGYNGEYTHTNLGLQYLRARYLNVATGTFTSRDTYAGKLQDILSQNRYTYAENNPVGHSDPSGHKVKLRNPLTRNPFQAAPTPTSTAERARQATQNSIRSYAIEQQNKTDIARYNVQNDMTRQQNNAQWTDTFLRTAMGMGTWSKAANSVIKDPYISQVALWIEKKKCQAYNICYNPIQEAIKNKDMTRITDGALLILDGVGKATAGGFLTMASIPMLASGVGTGFGAAGIFSGSWLEASGLSDITQGVAEIGKGWRGDSLTETENFMQKTFYDDNELAYQLSTNIATAAVDAYCLAASLPKLFGKGSQEVAEQVIKHGDELVSSGSPNPVSSTTDPYQLLKEKGIPQTLTDDEITAANRVGLQMKADDGTTIIEGSIGNMSKESNIANVTDRLVDGSKMNTDDVLDVAVEFLGEGYTEPVLGSGRFVSADGTRVFRMGANDILGRHGGGSHVNFEILEPHPTKPGKMQVVTDIHIFLED